MFITALFISLASSPSYASPQQIILVEDSRPTQRIILVEDTRPEQAANRSYTAALLAWYRSWLLGSPWFDQD